MFLVVVNMNDLRYRVTDPPVSSKKNADAMSDPIRNSLLSDGWSFVKSVLEGEHRFQIGLVPLGGLAGVGLLVDRQ